MHWDALDGDHIIEDSTDDPELAAALMQSIQEARKTPPPSILPYFILLSRNVFVLSLAVIFEYLIFCAISPQKHRWLLTLRKTPLSL